MPKRTKPSYRELQRQIAARQRATEAVTEHAQRLELARTVTREISCELDLPKLLQRIVQLTTVLEELGTIFDPFVQSSTTRTTAGGTGLGLSISREIAMAHQGRLWAENRPTGGTAFFLELPLSPQKKMDGAPASVRTV